MTETQIGTRIRQVRRARGLTQHQLAQRVNISVPMLRAYEQNKRTPDEQTLHKIADMLDFPVDYFLRGEPKVKMHSLFVCKLDDIFGNPPIADRRDKSAPCDTDTQNMGTISPEMRLPSRHAVRAVKANL